MDAGTNEADPREFMKTLPHRPLRRGGARLHAEGPGEDAAGRLDADRLRLRRPHRRRPPHRRREGERADRAAPLQAAERRLRRDPHLEAGARARRATGSRSRRARAPGTRSGSGSRARRARIRRHEGPRVARAGAQAAEPALREAPRLGGAGAGDPRLGLQEGRGLLPRARLGEAAAGLDRQQGDPAR